MCSKAAEDCVHSKTWRKVEALTHARQRLGVRAVLCRFQLRSAALLLRLNTEY
jgi:hypothetical protein